MLKSLYSPTNGAWRLAYSLQCKHPVNLYYMNNNSDYGFSRYGKILEHRSLMKTKSVRMDDGEFKTAVNNQLHYLALSEFLVAVMFSKAQEKYPLGKDDYARLLILFKDAIRSEPVPFDQISIIEYCNKAAKKLVHKKRTVFDSLDGAFRFLTYLSHISTELRQMAERFKGKNHDDLQVRHTIQHSANFMARLSISVTLQLKSVA